MKKILILFSLCAISFISCTGDAGPQGPAGFDGVDGQDGSDAAMANVFGETANFVYDADSNTWSSEIFDYNGTVDGDIFLVYLSLGDGLWTPMPASYFDDQGEFQYVFDHDVTTVQVSIIADSDLSTLGTDYIANIPIRVAIIPAILAKDFTDNTSNLEALMSALDIKESDVKTIH
ncbi:MAG: hypothetical protein V7767_04435 [Leeuwenhoekiella sp.]